VADIIEQFGMEQEVSRARQRLNCCVTGCLLVVFFVLAVVLGGIWYFYSGRDPLSPTAFMNEESRFVVAVRFDFDDEVSKTFLTGFKGEFGGEKNTTAKMFGALEHLSPGWTVTTGKDLPDDYSAMPEDGIWAVTYTHWWRVLQFAAPRMAGNAFEEVGFHGGVPVYKVPQDPLPYFALRENSVIYSTDLETIKNTLSRIAAGKRLEGPLGTTAVGMEWKADVTVLSIVPPAGLAGFDTSEYTSATPIYLFELDFTSTSAATGRLCITLSSDDEAGTAGKALETTIGDVKELLGAKNAEIKLDGNTVEILLDFEFKDPEGMIAIIRKVFSK
jgi:hypothetical protein